MQDSLQVPTPATLYSKLVAPNISEMKKLIIEQMNSTTDFAITESNIKLTLYTTPSENCRKYFGHVNSVEKLREHLPQWSIVSLDVLANSTIKVVITGRYDPVPYQNR